MKEGKTQNFISADLKSVIMPLLNLCQRFISNTFHRGTSLTIYEDKIFENHQLILYISLLMKKSVEICESSFTIKFNYYY